MPETMQGRRTETVCWVCFHQNATWGAAWRGSVCLPPLFLFLLSLILVNSVSNEFRSEAI